MRANEWLRCPHCECLVCERLDWDRCRHCGGTLRNPTPLLRDRIDYPDHPDHERYQTAVTRLFCLVMLPFLLPLGLGVGLYPEAPLPLAWVYGLGYGLAGFACFGLALVTFVWLVDEAWPGFLRWLQGY